MNKALIILQKEWREIRQQRSLLIGIILPPLIFTVLPLVIVSVIGQVGSSSGVSSGLRTNGINLPGMTPLESAQVAIASQLSILYVLLPGLLTSIIASYSIVGEKTSRTLEPLLATPVRTWELLLGKALAALVPALSITWLSGLIFMVGIALVSVSQKVFLAVISPGWLVLFFIWSPLLGMISIAVMIAVSSRVNDPRSAQQVSVWIIIPFFAMFFGQIAGLQVLGPVFTLIVASILIVLAVVALWVATQIFQREVILTRWK